MNNLSNRIAHTQDKILECQKLIDKFKEEIKQVPSCPELRTSLSLYIEYRETLDNILKAEQKKAKTAIDNEPSTPLL